MSDVKIKCPHCGQHIAFDSSAIGQIINCPSCGLSVALNVAGLALTKKAHGVFYYVFFGVISLFATLFILLGVAIMLGIGVPAFVIGVRAAHADSKPDTSRAPALNPSSASNTTPQQAPIPKGLATPASTATEQQAGPSKSDYIQNNLYLYDFAASIHTSELDGQIPGVDFKIKNIGNQTLTKIEVTVYFYDAGGYAISEEKYYPVLVTDTDGTPLKPNYIWQQDAGQFYAAKNVPSEWKIGSAKAVITDIDFAP